MTAIASEPELTKLYDGLSRYQWWRRGLSRARPGEGLAMRKRLQPGSDELAGVEDLNPWLWELANPVEHPRVLDLGAGFGDTLLTFARSHRGEYLGLGLSHYQIARAERQARSLGVADRCRFVRQSFDAPLHAEFDLVVSVETLFHASDVAHTLHRVADVLAPGGILVLVEDMAEAREVAGSTAGLELCARWATRTLHTRNDYADGLRSVGLTLEREHDLSALLQCSAPATRSRRRRRLAQMRACLPFGRQVVDAFLGGLAMEDLHESGTLRYRAMRARQTA